MSNFRFTFPQLGIILFAALFIIACPSPTPSVTGDTTAPEITLFTGPDGVVENAEISISLEGQDEVGITAWLVNLNDDTRPEIEDPSWGELPETIILPGDGSYTLYAWAKDAAGNISDPASITVEYDSSDKEAPEINSFSIPEETHKAEISISLDGTDNEGISAWLVKEENSEPQVNSSDWQTSKPDSFTLSAPGTITLYVWAKDEAGNISSFLQDSVVYSQYQLTITAEHGSVTVSPDQPAYDEDQVVTLSAQADEHYSFTNWTGDLSGTAMTLTITGDMNITAIFTEDPKYTLNVSAGANGSVSLSPDLAEYYEGTEVTITAIPDTGYTLGQWTGDFTGSKDSEVVTVNSNMNITASFRQPVWTILLHFAVDNDIDYDFEDNYGILTNYVETLESIKAADEANDIQILLMMDADNSSGNFSDGYYRITGGDFSDDLVVSKTEINSGDTAESVEFMDWAIENYPAEHYFYSIFNHGSGFDDQNAAGTYGIGFDNSNNDSLSHRELGTLTTYLKGLISQNIDVFYPYACLMGGVELAYEVKDNADYLLFSEESFPADYWSYEALEAIVDNSSISSQDLATAFCSSAYNYFRFNVDRGFTLAAIDLSQVDDLYTAIDTFAGHAISDITDQESAEDYIQLAYETRSMYADMGEDFYYIDLVDYLTAIGAASFTSSDVKTSAADIIDQLQDEASSPVIVDFQSYDMTGTSGISIFHNIKLSSMAEYNTGIYETILDFGTNQWADFQTALDTAISSTAADHYESGMGDDTSTYANWLLTSDAPEYHTIDAADDSDWFQLSLSLFDYTLIDFKADGETLYAELYEVSSGGDVLNAYAISTDQLEQLLVPPNINEDYYYIYIRIAGTDPDSNVVATGMYKASTTVLDADVVEGNLSNYNLFSFED